MIIAHFYSVIIVALYEGYSEIIKAFFLISLEKLPNKSLKVDEKVNQDNFLHTSRQFLTSQRSYFIDAC